MKKDVYTHDLCKVKSELAYHAVYHTGCFPRSREYQHWEQAARKKPGRTRNPSIGWLALEEGAGVGLGL